MKRLTKILCVGVIGSLVCLAIWYAYCEVISPWSSTDKIKSSLLKLTPIGSSLDDVKSVIKKNNWKQCFVAQKETERNYFSSVKGTYAIGVDFGQHCGFIFSYYLDAFWGFDSSGKLIDLKVSKIPLAL